MGVLHKHSFYLFAGVVFLLLSSCSQELTYREALDKNQKNFDDPGLQEDAEFLVDAKSFNLLEKELINRAVESGYASTLVDMGRAHAEGHESMTEELEKLARNKKIKLPSQMKEEHQSMLAEVSNSDRENFDRDLIRTLKRVNEENKNKYMDMATEAHDPDIRAFSARNLDMLRAHSQSIEDVEDDLLSTY